MRVTGPTQRRRNHAWLQMRSLEKERARLAQRQQQQAGDSSANDNSGDESANSASSGNASQFELSDPDDSADASDNRGANRANQPAQTLRSSAANPLASATVDAAGAGRASKALPTPVARKRRSARDQAARLAYLHRRDEESDDSDSSSGDESDASSAGGAGRQTQPARATTRPTLARPAASPVASLVANPVVARPVVASPVAASPVAASPVAASPVAAIPVVASPVVASPVVANPIASAAVGAGVGRVARIPSNVGASPGLGVTFGVEEGAVVDVETESDGIDSGVESVSDGIESDSENESSTAPPAATSAPAGAPPPPPPPALTSETTTSTLQAAPPPLTSSSSAKSSAASTSARTSSSPSSSRVPPQPVVTNVPIAGPSGDNNSSLDRLVTSLIGTPPAGTAPSPTVPVTGNMQSGEPQAGSPTREADQKGDATGLGTTQKNKLSGGAVGGIVIGVLAFLALIAAAAFFWRKHRRDRGLSFLPQPRFRLRDDEPRAPSVTQPLPGRVAGDSQFKTNTQIMDDLMKAAYATDNGFNDMEGAYAPPAQAKEQPLQQQGQPQSMVSAAPQLPAHQQASSFFMDEKAYAALAGPPTPRESKQKKPVMKWLDEVKTPTQPNGPEMPPTPQMPPSATLPRMPNGGPGGDGRVPDPPRPAYYGRDTMTTDTTNTSVRWYG